MEWAWPVHGRKAAGERWQGAVYLLATGPQSSFPLLRTEHYGGDSDTLLGTAWPSERDIWWPVGIGSGQHLGTEVPHEHPPPRQCTRLC